MEEGAHKYEFDEYYSRDCFFLNKPSFLFLLYIYGGGPIICKRWKFTEIEAFDDKSMHHDKGDVKDEKAQG